MLKFDEQTARVLETAYQGADVTRRRRANFDAVSPQPGEHILDLGCGNGMLALELARAVGPAGRVTGLDQSPDMLNTARDRCAGHDNIELHEGAAAALPFDAEQFDKAVSIQVFEYFRDMRPALTELWRVLRPGGRLVIGDIHWDTLAWHSDDPDRMHRMTKIWEAHLAELRAPALLPGLLRDCSFGFEHIEPVTICDTSLRPDGLVTMMMRLMAAFAVQTGQMDQSEVDDWQAEQYRLADEGRFFYAITHFVCVARKA